jgi:uncharacterized protein YjbI with pentapeptide repeats
VFNRLRCRIGDSITMTNEYTQNELFNAGDNYCWMDFPGIDLSNFTFVHINFTRNNFTSAIFTGARMERADFERLKFYL